jgi:hypothetical protein
VEPGGLFTLILIGFCLIAFGYRCAVIILRKPWPATSDDPYIVDVLRGRDAAETFGSGRGGSHVRATRQRPGGTHKTEHVISHHDGEGI